MKLPIDIKSFKKLHPGAIVALGLASLFLLWAIVKITKPKDVLIGLCTKLLSPGAEEEERASKVIEVEAMRVKTGTVTRRIAAVGKLRANNMVNIKAEINGRIEQINFKEGSYVEKGVLLIKFHDLDVRAELKESEAALARYRADFNRISQLHSQQVQSVKQLDEAKANMHMAEAKVEQAKSRLEKMNIIAPFSGNIGLIDVSPGAYIQAGQELVTLVDNNPIKLDFKVPEKNMHDIGAGQIAEIKLDAFPEEKFHAMVEAIDSSADSQSHSVAVRASLSNDSGKLKPGLFSNVSLIIGEKNDSFVVPEAALEREGEIEFVWAVEKSRATRKRVLTGTKESSVVEIVAGLKKDDIVVTDGQIKLYSGAQVKIKNDLTPASQPAKPLK